LIFGEESRAGSVEGAQSPLPSTASERIDLALPADVSLVQLRVDVPPGARVRVEVEARTTAGQLLGRKTLAFGPRIPRPLRLLAGAPASALTLSAWLAWLSLSLYLGVRLVGLPNFPIYFFTDEAVQTVLAADMLRDGLRSYSGEFLPTYFQNGSQYNLSASVYLQALPYYLFGKSIWVTRGAAALMTLLAAASVYLILQQIFRSPYPWLGVLLLSATPAWFLHSRTAFETALATSFFAAFLYCYLMYRKQEPRYLYGAVVFGALAFYAYTPTRIVIAAAALLLLISDLRYHWQNRRVILRGFALAVLLALPFLRFLVLHPEASAWQMRQLGSYWMLELSVLEKAGLYLSEYLHGLSPLYWYLPNKHDLPRHLMLDYGHLLRQTLPLGLLGIALALWKIRSPEYRVLLIAVLAAPAGAALVRLGITRALVMVIPMAILTALAASFLLEWLRVKRKVPAVFLSVVMFALLAGANIYMLRDSLVNGPVWFRDYGLNGMQFGAREVFGAVREVLAERPETKILITPSWANGTDVVARFFFRDPLPFTLGSAISYFNEARPLDENNLFVMSPEEYSEIPRPYFSEVHVERIIAYPDGRPGFYFVRLAYVDDIAAITAAEKEARRELQRLELNRDDLSAQLSYSRLDMGSIEDLFDGRPNTLVRSWAINPMLLDFDFAAPRSLQSAILRVGGTATSIAVTAWAEDEKVLFDLSHAFDQTINPRDVEVEFAQAGQVKRLLIKVYNTYDPPEGHVHLWEVVIK
jgi:4-amino-4-deoxy-L-arabinose transferase-like glycosyltransferase